jgi:hypothetical protein
MLSMLSLSMISYTILTLSIKTLNIMTFNKTTLSIRHAPFDAQHTETQYDIMLTVSITYDADTRDTPQSKMTCSIVIFRITTLTIMTLEVTSLRIMPLGITTLS